MEGLFITGPCAFASLNRSSLRAECSAAVILEKKPPRDACFLDKVSKEGAQRFEPAASPPSAAGTGVASSIVGKWDGKKSRQLLFSKKTRFRWSRDESNSPQVNHFRLA
jgi:hypothetical protein